jgi:hypothetical protein
VQAPSLVAEETAEADNADEVADDERSAVAVGQAGEEVGQDIVGLARLAGDLLLGELGLGAGSLRLALYPRRLRVGLYILLGEVGGDGADRGGVDIDEGRGAGRFRGDDLGRLGSGGLESRVSVRERYHWGYRGTASDSSERLGIYRK